MNVFRPHYLDPFSPVLLESPALEVTLEQKNAIREILDISSSDSAFADKAYRAITQVLTGGSVVTPTVTALTPSTVAVGDPSFDIHVIGTGFTPDSIIVFAGLEEPTTFISDTELTTGVNMDVWVGPDSVPVGVSNNGIMSNPMSFTFTSPSVARTGTIGMGQLIPGPTLRPADTHSDYVPVSPVTELKEHHSIKSAKEIAAEKEKASEQKKSEK